MHFADEEEGDVRPMSVLLDGNRDARGDLSFGYLAGRRKGWGPLAPGCMVAYQARTVGQTAKDLTVGRVLVNERDQSRVVLQPYEGHWDGNRVVHRPLFQTPMGYSLVPGPQVAKETVSYSALVLQVVRYAGGQL